MNKFAILALFACVATSLAASVGEMNDEPTQAKIFGSDAEEVAHLKGDKKIYQNFCLDVRNTIKAELSNKVNSAADRVFRMLFETIAEVGGAVGQAQQTAVEQGSEAVKGNARAVTTALGGVVNAMTKTGVDKLIDLADTLKSKLNKDGLQNAVMDACTYVTNDLKRTLDTKLTQYKKTLEEGEVELSPQVKYAKLENVGCLTTGRFSKMVNGCRLANAVLPSLMDFMGPSE